MSSSFPNPIDIHAFTQDGRVLSGELSSTRLPRLDDLAVGEATLILWSFSGASRLRADGSREARAELRLSGQVRMACTRCLQPIECMLDEHRGLRFVGTESQAESEDAEDDAFDVLVASRSFDLAGLIEDEVLLALPAAPRHPGCSLPSAAASEPARAESRAESRAGAQAGAIDAPVECPEGAQSRGLGAALRAAQARREKGGAKD
jgi:uncharacterized protein